MYSNHSEHKEENKKKLQASLFLLFYFVQLQKAWGEEGGTGGH